MRFTVHDKQNSAAAFTVVEIELGGEDTRGMKTFWLPPRDRVCVADRFVSLPIPHVGSARMNGFCGFTPDGDVVVVASKDKERDALEECLTKEFGQ